jgi:hypothetical protein
MKKLILLLLPVFLLPGWLAHDGWITANSQPSGPENYRIGSYQVIATANYDKYSPAVAYDTLHNEYLVVWEAANGNHQIFGRRIRGDGALLASFLISDATYEDGTFDRFNPAVAYDSMLPGMCNIPPWTCTPCASIRWAPPLRRVRYPSPIRPSSMNSTPGFRPAVGRPSFLWSINKPETAPQMMIYLAAFYLETARSPIHFL